MTGQNYFSTAPIGQNIPAFQFCAAPIRVYTRRCLVQVKQRTVRQMFMNVPNARASAGTCSPRGDINAYGGGAKERTTQERTTYFPRFEADLLKL